jgi:hypothetical protein
VLGCARLGSLLLSQLASRQLPLEPGIKVLDGLRNLIGNGRNGQPEAVMCIIWIKALNLNLKYDEICLCDSMCIDVLSL